MVSVIVPCYNTDIDLLDKCINSISNQSYKEIEIILVDDGSKKENIKRIRQIIEKYNSILFIEAEHGGLSSARNIGIREAKGEWVTFVDSDDFISPKMIEHLYKIAKDTRANIVLGKIMVIAQDEKTTFQEKITHI